MTDHNNRSCYPYLHMIWEHKLPQLFAVDIAIDNVNTTYSITET